MSSSPEPTSCENMVLPDPERHRIDRERFKEISVPDPSWTETPLITKVGKGKMESFACKKKKRLKEAFVSRLIKYILI